MPTELEPDICIIGAGSGGLSAAAAAAALGAEVVLIEKAEMGGDCLHRGCVPSKALIAAAGRANQFRTSGAFGIAPVEPHVDFEALAGHIRSTIDLIAPNDSEARFTSLGVRVIRAQARFADRRTVVAAAYRIRARRYIIATGSSPAVPSIQGLEEVAYLTSDDAFSLTSRPDHLAIIGGGPVGMELAQAFARLGSRVTVLEAGRALSACDPELARIALQQLRLEGIDIREHCKVARAEPAENGDVRLELAGTGEALAASRLLVAAGRTPDLAGLGLDKASIAFSPEGIEVDSRLRTSNRRVYAIGDAVAGRLKFTHLANHHAGLVIRSILFRAGGRYDPDPVPRSVFIDPGIAEVGLTEEEARSRYGRIRILRWPYSENDRAIAERRTSGLVRIILDRRGRILGAGIAGHEAAEQIAIWSLAVSRSMHIRDLTAPVLPYPTYAEAGKRAAISYYSPYARKRSVRRLLRFLRLLPG